MTGAGARSELEMDWARDLQAFFQYGADAPLAILRTTNVQSLYLRFVVP